jgi:hypothetical protein
MPQQTMKAASPKATSPATRPRRKAPIIMMAPTIRTVPI